jgi:hypothetical protein
MILPNGHYCLIRDKFVTGDYRHKLGHASGRTV